MLDKFSALSLRTRALLFSLLALGLFASASAQEIDISAASTAVNTLLGIGAGIVVAMVLFKLSKRGANKV